MALLEYLSDPAVASVYANGTTQHVPISGVEYTNPDLRRFEPWLERDTILAPSYQFLDLDVASAVEGSCTAVIGGKSPEQAAEEAQKVVEEQIS